jgi:hypothetical protein
MGRAGIGQGHPAGIRVRLAGAFGLAAQHVMAGKRIVLLAGGEADQADSAEQDKTDGAGFALAMLQGTDSGAHGDKIVCSDGNGKMPARGTRSIRVIA